MYKRQVFKTFVVEEINEGLEDAPEDVNTSPYKDGWMLRITLDADADKSQPLRRAGPEQNQ